MNPRISILMTIDERFTGPLGVTVTSIVENLAPTPLRFDSHSAKRAYMKAHGIREHVECVPGDKFLKRWV